ncbi:hypothetical protein EP1X_01260 [Thermococcus sp. EP1]|uniref:DUF354 domain-containing protein n=1 Tax=Thermococcus sp. EP1 TaxID=1591054 RepID=UPI0006D990E0|nr:DUF354 domain-containing protein [Thermococcus sp. EP1]KPU63856.1 hypothetical protein EP1X_01260 [Thermococcus sp. EP1]
MGRRMYDLWADIGNTPQIHVIRAIVKELREYSIYITGFNRGEVVQLLEIYGLRGKVFGSDKYDSLLKPYPFVKRSVKLMFRAPRAKMLLSFENAMPIPAGKLKGMKIFLILDNDLKVILRTPIFQRATSWLKRFANFILVPKVAEENFKRYFKEVIPYQGYKEHIYIADFEPDPSFIKMIPVEEYVVLRPESLTSLYVLHNKSLVPEILRLLKREGVDVVYLPRNKKEKKLAEGFKNVYIPPKALDGLNLIYHSKATLTGSGTMAREAAVMGVPAVSFFPRERLLAVDKDLVERGKMLHSREPEEIVEYVIENWNRKRKGDFKTAKRTKKQIIEYIKNNI